MLFKVSVFGFDESYSIVDREFILWISTNKDDVQLYQALFPDLKSIHGGVSPPGWVLKIDSDELAVIFRLRFGAETVNPEDIEMSKEIAV